MRTGPTEAGNERAEASWNQDLGVGVYVGFRLQGSGLGLRDQGSEGLGLRI